MVIFLVKGRQLLESDFLTISAEISGKEMGVLVSGQYATNPEQVKMWNLNTPSCQIVFVCHQTATDTLRK
jgi:hypothetical protein